jgi:hypothetical protein
VIIGDLAQREIDDANIGCRYTAVNYWNRWFSSSKLGGQTAEFAEGAEKRKHTTIWKPFGIDGFLNKDRNLGE